MRKGNFRFNKNMTVLVTKKGQLLFTKQRQYTNTRYERLRVLLTTPAFKLK